MNVLVTEPIHPDSLAWLRERCNVIDVSGDPAALESALPTADALIIRTYTRVDGALLAAAPRLRVVGRAGVGLDNVDRDACRERGITVINTPGANTQAVVEYVMAIIMDALRPREPLDGPLERSAWMARRDAARSPVQMSERRFGILGFGRIGSRVGAVAAAIGFDVVFHDLREIPPNERGQAQPVDRETLFATSHVISIHVDGRPENRQLLGAEAFARMRRDVLFVNASRGFVIDPAALAAHLRAAPESAAHLDVHEPEPVTADNPLLSLPNAHLYPHLAAKTDTAARAMSDVVVDVVAALGAEASG